jgi:hypothetical protein
MACQKTASELKALNDDRERSEDINWTTQEMFQNPRLMIRRGDRVAEGGGLENR